MVGEKNFDWDIVIPVDEGRDQVSTMGTENLAVLAWKVEGGVDQMPLK